MSISSPTTSRNALLAARRASNLRVVGGGAPLSAAELSAVARAIFDRQGLTGRDLAIRAEQLVLGFTPSTTGLGSAVSQVRARAAGITLAAPVARKPVSTKAGGSRVSLSIQGARMGAPTGPVQAGIFGSIGKFLGGAIGGFIRGGPIGAIRGGIGGVTGGGRSMPGTGRPTAFAGPQQAPPITPVTINPPFGGPPGAGVTFFPGPGQAAPAPPGPPIMMNGAGPAVAGARAPGIHLNKTSYFLRSGTFVPAGTKWVKNRRRNSLNPRALSRSIARVEGFKKATKRASRITIRKKC